ncbi:MAG TPA: diguanylate cyclase [Enterococcus sp.]|nr:diguanylate cyclase [Enterococcus sp.]
MEKYTLILFVMPIILLSVIIAFSFIIQRLTSIAKTPILQVVTMIILYIVYAYVTLKFPYNLLGFYSYTFVIETVMAYYFFKKHGHWIFLAPPALISIYYLLAGKVIDYEEIQIALLGISLFLFTLIVKKFSKFPPVGNVCLSFTWKWLVISMFSLFFQETYATWIDSTLIYLGSLLATFLLWLLYRLELSEKAAIEEMIHQGQTDALTGVYNFRKLGIDLQEYETKQHAYALAMIDLDYFKKLNDTFGHNAGNDILKEFSSLLTATLTNTIGQKNFNIYRFGGEEFCVLLFNCSKEDAQKHLTFFKNVYETRHRLLREANYSVTFSSGIETNEPYHYNGIKTLQYADTALYEAKHAGRNQIRIYQTNSNDSL